MKLLALGIVDCSRTHHFLMRQYKLKQVRVHVYIYNRLQWSTIFNNSSSLINNIYAGGPIWWRFFSISTP